MKILSLSILLLLTSCAPTVKDSIDTAVYNHKIAETPCAAAGACTPALDEALARFNENPTSEFCDALAEREDGDLAICEIDIRNEKYAKLLASCSDKLNERLDAISKLRNVGLSQQANFAPFDESEIKMKSASQRKFSQTEVQYRDLSNGYLAVTGDVKPKQVVLTFDDGPDKTNTVSVVRTLSDYGVKAHFFKVGTRIQANPRITQYVASEGHSIGNHSWSHPNFRKLSFEDGLKQVQKTQSLLHSIVGWVDPFFRFPFGANTKSFDQMLNNYQMASFKWAVDSNDWMMTNKDGSVRTNLQVINDTMKQLDNRGRGIILLHDIHRRTAELLPELLNRIHDRGYSIVLLQASNERLKQRPPIVFGDELP